MAQPNILTTNDIVLVLADETEIGSTDLSTAKRMRFTSENLNDNLEKVVSAEILKSREESDLLVVSRSCEGSVSAELSWDTYDSLLEAFLCNGFEENPEDPTELVLANGSERKSFTIEKEVGGKFRQFKGLSPSSISFDFSPGSIITFTVNFIGTKVEQTTSSAFTTVEDATQTIPMTGSSNVGKVEGLNHVQSINFEVNNNLRERRRLGSEYSFDIGYGTFKATGSSTMYFEDASMYDVYTSNDDFGFSIEVVEDDDKSYIIEFNRVKLGTYTDYANAKGEDLMMDLSFESLKNNNPEKEGSVVIKKIDKTLP